MPTHWQLVAILPAAAVDRRWMLVYSTFRDGISLRTMYRNMVAFENEDSPVVLVVRDDQLKVIKTSHTQIILPCTLFLFYKQLYKYSIQ